MKVDLNTMYRTPGVWVLCGLSVIFFVEVDADGRCFQLKPTTFDRDGELSRDGWTGNPIIVGPLARPHRGITTPAEPVDWQASINGGKSWRSISVTAAEPTQRLRAEYLSRFRRRDGSKPYLVRALYEHPLEARTS